MLPHPPPISLTQICFCNVEIFQHAPVPLRNHAPESSRFPILLKNKYRMSFNEFLGDVEFPVKCVHKRLIKAPMGL